MRTIFFFAALFFAVHSGAQIDPVQLPQITPPSPEAAALTKYANLEASEYSGMVRYDLPLYTYEVGGIKLPISLNYIGRGVKVNDIPTWVGINWTLDIGGVITRQMRDMPDEIASTRVIFDAQDVEDYDNTFDCTPEAAFLENIGYQPGSWDSEVDIFSFNFAGYSGSFYLDQQLTKGVLQKQDSELKIEVIGNLISSKEFKITTPDGVAYFFGGEAIERTSRRYVTNGSMSPNDTHEGVTSFYLYKIDHPFNGTIFFDYGEELEGGIPEPEPKIFVAQKIQKMIRLRESNPPELECPCEIDPQEPWACPQGVLPKCTNMPDYDPIQYQNITVSVRNFNPIYLKKIYNDKNSDTIFVNSSHVDNRHFSRVLNNLTMTRGNNILKTVDFNYLGFEASTNPLAPYSDISKRFFLERVVFDDAHNGDYTGGRKNEVYTFIYNSPNDIPDRFDYGQDYIGYYNGIENPSAIPICLFTSPNGLDEDLFADRTPNFYYASKGTLTDIIYPTGGRTHFDYQAKKTKRREMNQGLNLHAYRLPVGQSKLVDYVPQWIDANTKVTLDSIPFQQTVDFYISLKATGGVTTISPQGEKARFRLYNYNNPDSPQLLLDTGWIVVPSPSGDINSSTTVEKQVVISHGLSPGIDYKAEVEVFDPPQTDATEMEARVSMQYQKETFEIFEREGIYLKRQTDFPADGTPENIRRYYYGDAVNLEPSLEDLPLDSEHFWVDNETYITNFYCSPNDHCINPPAQVEYVLVFSAVSSEKFDDSNVTGVDRFEKITISYGGDNFERGGVEKTFAIFPDYGAALIETFPGSNPTSLRILLEGYDALDFPDLKFPSPLNGVLLKEKTLAKQTNYLAKIKEKEFSYLNTLKSPEFISVTSKKLYDPIYFGQGCTIDDAASCYTFGAYIVPAFRSELEQEKTIEFIDPVPITVEDDSSYRKVVIQTDYEYGDLVGLPTGITTTGSDGVSTEVKNYYVDRFDSLPGNPSLSNDEQDAYEALLNRNSVSKPIQVEAYKGSELLARQRTVYKEWDNSPDRIFPSALQLAKGTNSLEDRIVYNDYDSRGNLSKVRKSYGCDVWYCYNLDNKPTLKVENYTDPNQLFPLEAYQPPAFDANNPEYPMHDEFAPFNSMVTVYRYDPITKLLTSITDPKRNTIFYEYDALQRLIRIRDNNGYILNDYSHNFKKY